MMAKVLLICVVSLFGVMIPILLDRYRLQVFVMRWRNCVLRWKCGLPILKRVPYKGCIMKNFEFLFVAWMAVWAVFFVYEVSVASRIARLRDEVERLKQQLREG